MAVSSRILMVPVRVFSLENPGREDGELLGLRLRALLEDIANGAVLVGDSRLSTVFDGDPRFRTAHHRARSPRRQPGEPSRGLGVKAALADSALRALTPALLRLESNYGRPSAAVLGVPGAMAPEGAGVYGSGPISEPMPGSSRAG
jgi:hypothetical protein